MPTGADEMMNMNEVDDLDLPEDTPPILKVGEEKEIGKQGLKKKLLKEGQNWDTPENGDEVEGGVFCFFFFFNDCFAFFVVFKELGFIFLVELMGFFVVVDFSSLYGDFA